MAIDKKPIDQLLTEYKKPEDIIGENDLLKERTRAILERALQGRDERSSGLGKHDRSASAGERLQRKEPEDLAG